MRKEFFSYLQSYSVDPEKVDRIIVSNFLYSKNLNCRHNILIKGLIIGEEAPDYNELKKVMDTFSISSIEDLVEAFEFVISPEEKVVTGAVYTPSFIREYIVDQSINNFNQIDDSFKICDPACGCSGFLFTAAKKIKEITGRKYAEIFRHNLFGLDIQEFAIERSKILLSLVAIADGEDEEFFDFNLHLGNALNFDWTNKIQSFEGFDVVVGNPPYVCSKNIDNESKNLIYNWAVSKSGHPDLYIPFFEIGLTLLKPNGILGYITMNTFFKSLNGRALREYFQTSKFDIKIIDFGSVQIFHSKSTYTCICLIQNSPSESIMYARLSNMEFLALQLFSFQAIDYTKLNYEKGWNLQEIEILNKIEDTGTPLGKKFTTRNGVATLKNDVYIFDPVEEDDNFLYLQNGRLCPIEKQICVDIVNPNMLNQLDTIDPLRKKIIFPYEVDNGQPKIIPEREFAERFPFAYNYLLSKKDALATRDKGKGKDYDVWYSYGRNQSLEPYTYKLFFPHIAPSTPNFVINDEPSLLFVNGLAIISDSEDELLYLRKIMSSRLFWFYIINSSKPYGSGYYSLSRNYIKNFGIYDFSKEQMNYLTSLTNQREIDDYLEDLYEIKLDDVVLDTLQQLTV